LVKSQTALAADLDLTKVAIGGLLDRMESAGYVQRRADNDDGRLRRVYLSRAGSRLVNTIRENVEAVELDILSRIPEERLTQAAETLMLLKRTLLEKIGAEAEEVVGSDIASID